MARTGPALSDAFSRLVKKHREARSLSRVALAEAAGLHQTYIGLLERGERSPSLDTADAIAKALGSTLGKLIAEAEKLQNRNKPA
ncbi:MAG: helix-turn-helix transcriptional regulator [Verrucomicrobiota bacterium]